MIKPFIPGGFSGPIPNPISLEGALVVGTAIGSNLFTRPGPPVARPMSGALGQFNAKMEIHDLNRTLGTDPDPDLPKMVEAHFNPVALEKVIKVHWNKLPVPGLSHQRHQYHHTENVQFKFDLQFEALQITLHTKGQSAVRGFDGPNGIGTAARFIESLCYPAGDAQSVQDGAPPRVLFFWPNFLSITCVVAEEHWKTTMFAQDGTPRRQTCSLTLEEIRDTRLTSSDVLRKGDRRSVTKPGSEGENVILVRDPIVIDVSS